MYWENKWIDNYCFVQSHFVPTHTQVLFNQHSHDITFNQSHPGVILPGGDAELADSGYARIAKMTVKYSIAQAKKNITFPVSITSRSWNNISPF